ncbi:hypothetical protein HDU96_005049, partial [Phlyctochytrium bullatum]
MGKIGKSSPVANALVAAARKDRGERRQIIGDFNFDEEAPWMIDGRRGQVEVQHVIIQSCSEAHGSGEGASGHVKVGRKGHRQDMKRSTLVVEEHQHAALGVIRVAGVVAALAASRARGRHDWEQKSRSQVRKE